MDQERGAMKEIQVRTSAEIALNLEHEEGHPVTEEILMNLPQETETEIEKRTVIVPRTWTEGLLIRRKDAEREEMIAGMNTEGGLVTGAVGAAVGPIAVKIAIDQNSPTTKLENILCVFI
eukprot:Filipodium_phascolosomae@DN2183_c0_g1_i1.p1